MKTLFSDRSSTQNQLSLVLAVLIGGTLTVSLVAVIGIVAMRREIVKLSEDTSPTQILLAKLQRGFERVSGDFARISAASSRPELVAIQSDLTQTFASVDRIAEELDTTQNGDALGGDSSAIRNMVRTGDQLRTIAGQRLEARKKVAEATTKVTGEIEKVTSLTDALSTTMAGLQTSSQAKLLSSTRINLEANESIKGLLSERVQTEQLRSCLQQTGIVDNRFRLNVLRDRAAAILDSMSAQELHDPALVSQIARFSAHFGLMFDGEAGLLSARAATLAHPDDKQVSENFKDREKNALAAVNALSSRMAEEIDPLQFAVVKADAGMEQAAERIGQVTSISSVVGNVALRARLIHALAWKLLTSANNDMVDRTVDEIQRQNDAAVKDLDEIHHGLLYLNRSGDVGSTKGVPEAFAHVRSLLIGPGGVASDVQSDLDKQRHSGYLFDTALRSIRQITEKGSMRARSSESEQELSETLIQKQSATTLLLVSLFTLGVLLISSSFGRRVFKKVLATEDEQSRLKETLRHLAFHDGLTGLPNRLHFEELLATAFAHAASTAATLAVLCVDLDRFKQINDRMGHRTGDLYLIEIADRMKRAIGANGVVARMGGDEFSILVTDVPEAGTVLELGQRLLETLAVPVNIENCLLQAGGSIGVARFPHDGNTAVTLQKNADKAMYRAKKSGRNQCVSFDWGLNEAEEENAQLQKALADALQNGDFRVVYQPQYDSKGGLNCLEALLRFRHPKFGAIPPSRFIPMAEDIGLIVPMGDWVMREVVRQSMQWQQQGLRPIRIAVNVSAVQFGKTDFLMKVTEVLRESGLAPELLELELTESVVMSHVDDTHSQMLALRSLGIRISIDDFGTGYSSLSYLHKLPVDTIKIDQSFVREMHAVSSTLPLIQAIVSAAHAFGLEVVAEGVETLRQSEALIEIGCDSQQGYLFARPLAPEMVEELLQENWDPAGHLVPAIEGSIDR